MAAGRAACLFVVLLSLTSCAIDKGNGSLRLGELNRSLERGNKVLVMLNVTRVADQTVGGSLGTDYDSFLLEARDLSDDGAPPFLINAFEVDGGWQFFSIEPGIYEFRLLPPGSANKIGYFTLALSPTDDIYYLGQFSASCIDQTKCIVYQYTAENITYRDWAMRVAERLYEDRKVKIVATNLSTQDLKIDFSHSGIAYRIKFDYETLESGAGLDERFSDFPSLCGPAPTPAVALLCILDLTVRVPAWFLDELLYQFKKHEWQPCLKKISNAFRRLDGLNTLKEPVQMFLDAHKIRPVAELPSGYDTNDKDPSRALGLKYGLDFTLEGPELKNVGGEGLFTVLAEAIFWDVQYHRILRTWQVSSERVLEANRIVRFL